MVTNLLFGDDYFDFERRHFVLATMAIAFFRRSLVRFPLVSEQRCEIDNKVALGGSLLLPWQWIPYAPKNVALYTFTMGVQDVGYHSCTFSRTYRATSMLMCNDSPACLDLLP